MLASIATSPVPGGPTQAPLGINLGGILPAMSAADMIEQNRRRFEQAQAAPVIQGLAAHVKQCWTEASQAKQEIEERMHNAVRARRGEYDQQRLQMIRQQGGSEIFMMLTSNKCRAAGSWLRDVMLGKGDDKPWSLRPTPVPSLPPQIAQELQQEAIEQVAMLIQATGKPVPGPQMRKLMMDLREQYMNNLNEVARFKSDLMEDKMEDQLTEGGFPQALDAMIDDITTFPAAFIKGPVVRNKPKLQWIPDAQGGYTMDVQDTLVLEWERVDPFNIYPSPSATGINDGYLIERHKMRRADLEALLGVDGYDDDAIRKVLDEYGSNGLMNWLMVDSQKAEAEGRTMSSVMTNPEGLIEALQFWGSLSGKMLVEFGLDEAEVPDQAKEYPCEVWLVGNYVIKASLNYHPLGLKPYFKASYEDIPGLFWGNSVYDLVRDCQDMCNSAARALANNMGIASGPQVVVNVDRIPAGEDITQLFPWKIHQAISDPMGSTAPAVDFFQPSSNANELMAIYEKFSVLADEYSGIPRYMTGDSPAGGAGRTASGMSMLMTNANKSMKQVVSNIDAMMQQLLDRLYFYNMKYSEDDELKGDVQIVASGAASLIAKENAQVRRNEFLAATANPFDMQILGLEGRRALLRESAKGLDMNPDLVVPTSTHVGMVQQLLAATQPPQQPGAPAGPAPSGQTLMDGTATTDNFGPSKKPNP